MALDDHIAALRGLHYGAVDPTLLPIAPRRKGLSVKDERRRREVLDMLPVVREVKALSAGETIQSVAIKLGLSPRTLKDWQKNFHRRKGPG